MKRSQVQVLVAPPTRPSKKLLGLLRSPGACGGAGLAYRPDGGVRCGGIGFGGAPGGSLRRCRPGFHPVGPPRGSAHHGSAPHGSAPCRLACTVVPPPLPQPLCTVVPARFSVVQETSPTPPRFAATFRFASRDFPAQPRRDRRASCITAVMNAVPSTCPHPAYAPSTSSRIRPHPIDTPAPAPICAFSTPRIK